MKKRTFYIVNLDRNRILLLVVIFAGFLLTAYATGYRLANSGRSDADRKMDPTSSMSLPEHGDSIYSQRESDDMKQNPSSSRTDRKDISDRPDRTDKVDDRIDLSRNMTLSPDRTLDRQRSVEKSADRSVTRKDKRHKESAVADNKKHESDKKREAKDKQERVASKGDKSAKGERNSDKSDSKSDVKTDKSARTNVEKSDTKPARDKSEGRGKEEAALTKGKNPRSALLESSTGNRVKMGDPGPEDTKQADPRTAKTESKKPSTSNGEQRKEQSTSSKEKHFSLQVGAFQTKGAADRMVENLKTQGFEARVTSGRGHYAVRVGKPSRPGDLEKTELSLKKKSYAPVRVPEE